ncbi:MAG: hypothetical protein ABIH84_02050 [bacterium]
MRGLNKFPPEYFLKYKEKPVKLKPYDPIQEEIGNYYLEKLKKILQDFDVAVLLRGSSLYKIAGKGEVEIGVYPKEVDWVRVVELLKKNFGKPENVEESYVKFNQTYNDVEIEIILLKGHEANVDIKLHEYLLNHRDLLKEYEKVKQKSAYSKREYQIQKNTFLGKVIELIPK